MWELLSHIATVLWIQEYESHIEAGMTDTEKRVRKDVALNRARLLEAGKQLFAERGLDASIADIAQRAGIGTATAYRYFGSKPEIIAAIFGDAAQSFTSDAERALTIDDAWLGLVAFVEAAATRQVAARGLYQLFTGEHGAVFRADDWSELAEVVDTILERAKKAGAVRGDIQSSDLFVQLMTMGSAYAISSATSTEVWRRQLDLFLRAIQSTAPPAVVTAPSAIDSAVLSRLMSRR